MKVTVPAEFAEDRIRKSGDAGRRWLAELPCVLERVCEQWDVELADLPPRYGDLALVLLAWRDAEPCVLKVAWTEHSTREEAAALRAWDGRGAVRLLAASEDDNALLLERLEPDRSLDDLALLPAAEIAGGLINQLAVPAPPEVRALPELESFAERNTAQGEPLPQRWIELADELAPRLWVTSARSLVHTDLHYGNILAGKRQPWLAIDPRPLACDPERSVPELMWWRLDLDAPPALIHTLLDAMVAAGDLDAERARCWTIVRVASYWLWCLRAGLTEDPVRCRRLLEALT